MGSRHKRKFELDPNKSDSDDEDYDNAAAPPRSAKPSRRHKPTSSRKPIKRRRDTYGDSDDDVEEDDDVSDDEGSFDENSEEEEQEVNPRTGRRVRSAAKDKPKYEESDEDEEVFNDSDSDSEPAQRPPKISPKKRSARDPALTQQRLVVKLKLPAGQKMDRGDSKSKRPGSRSSRQDFNAGPPTRRSSRLSHDNAEELVALSNSMKHEVTVRQGSAEPESASRRPTRAGKGLKTYPSAIQEVSQEDGDESVEVQSSQAKDEELVSQLEEAAGTQQDEIAEATSRTMPEDDATEKDEDEDDDIRMEEPVEEEHVVQESQHDPEDNDDDEDDPIVRAGRAARKIRRASSPPASQTDATRRSLRARKSAAEPSSDFEPDAEGEHEVEEEMSDDEFLKPPRTGGSSNEGSSSGRRSGRLRSKAGSQRSRSRRHASEDEAEEELDVDEIADEAAELDEDARRNRRPGRRAQPRNTEISYEPKLRERGKKPDYRIFRPEYLAAVDEEENAAPAPSPQRKGRGGGTNFYRSLFSTVGPFGGAGEPRSVFGGPAGAAAAGGVDSDSSDDEARGGQAGVGGTTGMTPTSGFPKPFPAPQAHNNDPLTGTGGGPPGLGKVKDRKALADADPLGVDPNVNFDGVGGLENHINQLKEMVMLPLLYPELFLNFHVTPPRGVLFHGPPGTGKTLLARALASSVSTNGRKVTFYMRKGADALSKWVGEAEKQLRLLFEEARKNQPSIIFFDEIDGLAPVRSSKQEQIHASIVATLLALMDGMDGRGQVIVIGATNRPDSVDPALRRPGRFDREFYFPLPDQAGRRAIIDIHTKGWEPALSDPFKNQLAEITRGYGGADLRALCTEAALNAVQGTYPQIYSSEQKLIVDASKIKVLAKDFMISVNKIVPSSERSAASGAAPLKKDIEPLLRAPLAAIGQRLEEVIPRKRKITALEEALYDDRDDEYGFEKETMQREFESSRIFRPRLLIQGREGMGQQYLGAALLSKFEGLHVQNFDLPTLMKDSARSPEAAIVQLFEEVKRHKPSVIYIPNVDIWYATLTESALRTFSGLLRSLQPTDPVLLLGIMDVDSAREEVDPGLKKLFQYSMKNLYTLERPSKAARAEFYQPILDLLAKKPLEFPDLENRKKRKLEVLPLAPVAPPREPTEAELREQRKRDRLALNQLRIFLLPVMEQVKKYKRFRAPVVDENIISYLFDDNDPNVLSTDLTEEQRQQQQLYRPFELSKDKHGHPGIREVATGKFYYNLEIVTIEKRLNNGYYKRPMDFAADFKRIVKDSHLSGDEERYMRAKDLHATVEVDMAALEEAHPHLAVQWNAVYAREVERERKQIEKAREAQRKGEQVPVIIANVPPPIESKTSSETYSGPILLGQPLPGPTPHFPTTPNQLGPRTTSDWSTTNTNGTQNTNGFTVPSRPVHEDSELFDSSQDVFPTGRPAEGYLSQSQPAPISRAGSALTHMAPGSNPEQYPNSASSTTSGQKTHHTGTNSSGRTSGQSNANGEWLPDYATSGIHTHNNASQFTDTQPPSVASQLTPPDSRIPPPQREARIDALLNNPDEPAGPFSRTGSTHPPTTVANTTMTTHATGYQSASTSAFPSALPPHTSGAALTTASTHVDADGDTAMSPPPPPAPHSSLVLDHLFLKALHIDLVTYSSGLSLEQLEQTHAAMMRVLWRDRTDWNRNSLAQRVKDAFNACVRDIEACQGVEDPSQASSGAKKGRKGGSDEAWNAPGAAGQEGGGEEEEGEESFVHIVRGKEMERTLEEIVAMGGRGGNLKGPLAETGGSGKSS